MINERSSAQPNTPTSANMQYSYQSGHFDLMSIAPMQNPNDLYSYYPPSLYQPFSPFDEHNQWATADSSGNVPPPPPGPMQYHPQMYTPSQLDLSRSPFDYPPLPHPYPHYHPGFTTSTFPGPPPPSTGTSAFDMSWSPHSLPMQQMQMPQQQMTPIGGGPASSKKPSVYDEYPTGGVSDMLAQQMNAVDLGGPGNNDDNSAYDNGTNDGAQNVNVSSAKDQQHYQSNSSNLSISARATQAPPSGGPKSYASVVSADTLNLNSNKPTPAVSNMPVRSATQPSTIERNNSTSNYSNDSMNSRPNMNLRGSNSNNYPQQTRNGASGYNSRHQQQQQQHQSQQQHQQSSGGGGSFSNWSNNNLASNSRGGNNNNSHTNASTTYYNSGASNYYDRSSYSQQQQAPSYNSKRHNQNYQPNYSSSRTTHQTSNGNAAASAVEQQPISAANQDILDTLKKNQQYNPRDFSVNTKGARFFVIKSYSEDDVHRSIKYNIWCSTEHGNKRLDDAFREREGKGPIYLFFSVNASGHFCGMAEMMSPVDYEHKTDVWQMSNKWQGKFEVKWIYVKDVPNQQFRNIRLENNDNKPVTNSRDTQEIPYEKGKQMLKTMHMYRDKTSIFDDFLYYESKQAEEVVKKPTNNEYGNNNQRGANNNKRQYSSNRPTSSAQSDQPPPQQQQQQQQETESPDDEDNN